MAVQHITKARESFESAIARLAVEAEAAGVEVYEYRGAWYAVSQSEPHRLHAVNLYGCDCRGFQHWGRCRHLARLLDVTHNLPGRDDLPPAPEPASPVCPTCGGDGFVKIYTGGHFSDWWPSTCQACGGAGTVTVEVGRPAAA